MMMIRHLRFLEKAMRESLFDVPVKGKCVRKVSLITATSRGMTGLPVPYIPDIHMHKIGLRIIPDATGLLMHTDVP